MKQRHVEPLEVRRLLASPELDLTFGEGGVAATSAGSVDALAISETAGGKYVAVGGGYDDQVVVARFNHDGTPDVSFDGDGLLSMRETVYGDVAAAAAGPDGKLVLLYKESLKDGVKIFRFNADGTVDSSFGSGGGGGGGSITYQVNEGQAFIDLALAIQTDGKIIIGYTADSARGNGKSYLVRLNADGSVDNAFRGGFANGVPLPSELFKVYDMAVGPGGKVYANGVTNIVGLNSDGSLDSGFGGGDGVAEAPALNGVHGDSRLSVAPDGKLLVLSKQDTAHGHMPILARLLASGAVDTSFGGGDGFVEIPTTASYEHPLHVLVGPDGKITGVDDADGYTPLSMFRVTADGVLDPRFGKGGVLVTQIRSVQAKTVALDSAGNILLAGHNARFLSPNELAIARYVPGGPDVVMNPRGSIFVAGTDNADVVSVSLQADQVVVTLNGASTSFAAASVKTLSVFTGGGGDVITSTFDVNCEIGAGTGNDTITLAGGDVLIEAGAGNDRITCGKGKHDVFLGEGNNRSVTGRGKDTIIGGGGNDTIITGAQSDYILAQGGDDSIRCASGWDSIYTGDGNDTVFAGPGNDKVQDTLEPSDGSDGDPPGLATGHKHYYGEDGHDSITGSMDADTIFGNGGADTIQGSGGADSISGGGGNDELFANYYYPDSPYNNGIDSNRNTIHGGEQDDHIFGASGRDKLYGDSGNDRLFGMGGSNFLSGGDGADRLDGTSGKDSLFGDAGRDTVFSDGNDVLNSVEVRRSAQ